MGRRRGTASRRRRRPCPRGSARAAPGTRPGRTPGRRPGRSRRRRVTSASPVRSAAPLPWFFPWKTTRSVFSASPGQPPAAASSRASSRVPSVEQSSTTMISFSSGTARTCSRSCGKKARSLYSGITTESFTVRSPFCWRATLRVSAASTVNQSAFAGMCALNSVERVQQEREQPADARRARAAAPRGRGAGRAASRRRRHRRRRARARRASRRARPRRAAAPSRCGRVDGPPA